jgi:hypothetical protein
MSSLHQAEELEHQHAQITKLQEYVVTILASVLLLRQRMFLAHFHNQDNSDPAPLPHHGTTPQKTETRVFAFLEPLLLGLPVPKLS